MSDRRFLVTGAMGCIGAWVLRALVDDGADVLATDMSDVPTRPRLLLSEAELDGITWARLDVTDSDAVRRAVAENGISHIVHLAGLQIPFCRETPVKGAAVNVVGTVNILEAARHEAVRGLSYASSLAALGPADIYDTWPVPDDAARVPHTLYGVYKVANEETARIYYQDWGVGSVGLRPYTVFGIGRDQGVTADAAKAILAASAGRPFHIRFSGEVALQHASDVARIFIDCALAEVNGAPALNLRNDVVRMNAFADLLAETVVGADITVAEDADLPFPGNLDDGGLRQLLGTVPHTPLKDAIEQDVDMYRDLMRRDLVDMSQLER